VAPFEPGSGASVDADSLEERIRPLFRPPGGQWTYGGGNMDYTAQNAEIARRSRAAHERPQLGDVPSRPSTRAKIDAANARHAGAGQPGVDLERVRQRGGYWTPDAAHNNAAGSGRRSPARGRRSGKAEPRGLRRAHGRAGPSRSTPAPAIPCPAPRTAAQRAQPQGAPQWQPPPGAPPQPTAGGEQGYGRGYSPTGTMQQTGATPPAQAPAAPSPTPGQQPPTQAAAWKPGAPLPVWDPQKGYQTPSSGRSPGGTY
jgi:hypothetical protein